MKAINDNNAILNNGEPRSVLDKQCKRLGIPNIPEYIDAIDDGKEKRLVVLSTAGVHFLTDKRLKELELGPEKEAAKHFKKFLNEITGKRGELKMFKTKKGEQ
jgi:hypothetical protein